MPSPQFESPFIPSRRRFLGQILIFVSICRMKEVKVHPPVIHQERAVRVGPWFIARILPGFALLPANHEPTERKKLLDNSKVHSCIQVSTY
jgi:hypothetical protein